MSIPLRLIDNPHIGLGWYADVEKVQPGDCWREPELDGEHGDCWTVVLPNSTLWHSTVSSADGYWTVTGEAPALTVTPSINDTVSRSKWHGWIRDGQLVDA